ncbi:MAG: hypothetical protein RLO01_02415 [Thalassobaculaceae bacterium]
MPSNYSTFNFDPEFSIITFTIRGRADSTGIIDTIRQAFEIQPADNSIWDLSEADLSELDHRSLQQIIDAAKPINRQRKDGARTALVAGREDARALLSLFRALNQYAPSHIEYRVVGSIEEAKRWIAEG